MKLRFVAIGLAIAVLGVVAVVATGSTGSATPTAPAAEGFAMTMSVEVSAGTTISFPVESFSTGATNSSTIGGAGSGKSTLLPLNILKNRDADTVLLYEWVLTGKHLPKATLNFSTNGRYVLEDLIVSAVNASGNGDRTRDQVVFNARKVKVVQGGANVCWDSVAFAKCTISG